MSNVNDSFTYDANTIRIFSSLFFVFTAVFGTMGNVSLCYVILKTKSLRTHLNSYIMNIAIADLLSCFVLMPLRIVVASEIAWNVNVQIVCGGEMFVRVIVDAARLFFLAYVSYERYLAIANPFNRDKRIPKVRAVIATCIIWTMAVGLASLAVLHFSNNTLMEACETKLKDHTHGLVEVYVLAPVFVLTVVLIILFYILIIRILMKHRSMMSRYFGNKSKNKVKPADEYMAGSNTPQKQLMNYHETLAAVSSTSNSEIPLNVHSDVANANSNTIESAGVSYDGEAKETHLKPTFVIQSKNSVEPLGSKDAMCVSENIEKLDGTSDTSRYDGIPTINTPSVVENQNNCLNSTTLLTSPTKNIAKTQTAEENHIAVSCIEERLPIIRVDDVEDSKNIIVEDFSSSDDVLEENRNQKGRKLGVDYRVKGGHPNTLKVLEQNVSQKGNKYAVVHLPDQQQCQTASSKDQESLTVNEHNLQNNKTAYNCNKENIIVVKNNMDRDQTVFLDNKDKLVLEDNNVYQSNKAKMDIDEREPNQSVPVLSNSKIDTTSDINNVLENCGAIINDKTSVIVYDLEQNETVAPTNENSNNSEGSVVNKTKNASLEETDTVAHNRSETSVEKCDYTFSGINISNETSGEKDVQEELTIHTREESKSDVLVNNYENSVTSEKQCTTISVEDHVDSTTNMEMESKQDICVKDCNKTISKITLHDNNSVDKDASVDVTRQKRTENKTEKCENDVSKTNSQSKTSDENSADTELVTVVKVKNRSKSPGDQSKRSKQKAARTVNVVDMDGKVHRESMSNASGAVCKRDDDSKIRGRRKVELKAAKRIIAVIGTFFSLWIPYPFSVILSSRVDANQAEHAMWLHVMLLMSSVSAITSAVMPVLNGVSNKQIKSAALRIYRKLLSAYCKKGA